MSNFNSHRILVNHYKDELRSVNWSDLIKNAYQNASIDPDNPDFIMCRELLGSVMSMFPSGKIYTFWTSNQTRSDIRRDQAYSDALNEILDTPSIIKSEVQAWIEFFDTDVFISVGLDLDEALKMYQAGDLIFNCYEDDRSFRAMVFDEYGDILED